MKNKFISFIMIFVIAIFAFGPYLKVNANDVNRLAQRIVFSPGETSTEVVPATTNLTDYINEKKQLFENTLVEHRLDESLNHNLDYNSLFSIESGNYFYAVIDAISEPSYSMVGGNLTEEIVVTYNTINVSNTLPSNKASIIYDANGGTGYMPGVVTDSGESYILLDNQFNAPRGQMFEKWWIDGIGYKNPGDEIVLNGVLVAKAIWQEAPAEFINNIDLTIKRPRVGDKVTVTEQVDEIWGYTYEEPDKLPVVTVSDGSHFSLDYRAYITAYPSMNPDGYDTLFRGTFVKDQYYYVEVSLFAEENYVFNDNDTISVTVNGETTNFELNQYNGGGSPYFLLYAKVKATENVNLKEYTLNSGDFTVSFTDEEGMNYQLMMFDILKLSKEEILSLVDSEEEFNKDFEIIKNNTSQYGNLLSVYAIEVSDNGNDYTGKAKVKIKKTDETKKYNRIRLVYIDENNNFKVGDVIELTEEGDYYVGEVPHLSVYALVGDNVEKTNNPKTVDNIYLSVIIFGISLSGIAFLSIYTKKKRNIKEN